MSCHPLVLPLFVLIFGSISSSGQHLKTEVRGTLRFPDGHEIIAVHDVSGHLATEGLNELISGLFALSSIPPNRLGPLLWTTAPSGEYLKATLEFADGRKFQAYRKILHANSDYYLREGNMVAFVYSFGTEDVASGDARGADTKIVMLERGQQKGQLDGSGSGDQGLAHSSQRLLTQEGSQDSGSSIYSLDTHRTHSRNGASQLARSSVQSSSDQKSIGTIQKIDDQEVQINKKSQTSDERAGAIVNIEKPLKGKNVYRLRSEADDETMIKYQEQSGEVITSHTRQHQEGVREDRRHSSRLQEERELQRRREKQRLLQDVRPDIESNRRQEVNKAEDHERQEVTENLQSDISSRQQQDVKDGQREVQEDEDQLRRRVIELSKDRADFSSRNHGESLKSENRNLQRRDEVNDRQETRSDIQSQRHQKSHDNELRRRQGEAEDRIDFSSHRRQGVQADRRVDQRTQHEEAKHHSDTSSRRLQEAQAGLRSVAEHEDQLRRQQEEVQRRADHLRKQQNFESARTIYREHTESLKEYGEAIIPRSRHGGASVDRRRNGHEVEESESLRLQEDAEGDLQNQRRQENDVRLRSREGLRDRHGDKQLESGGSYYVKKDTIAAYIYSKAESQGETDLTTKQCGYLPERPYGENGQHFILRTQPCHNGEVPQTATLSDGTVIRFYGTAQIINL